MSQGKGINNNDLKQKNRGLLLRLLATGESDTRVGLAKASRLTRMSVTNIIEEFVDKKLVVEGAQEKRDSRGRSPVRLEISSNAPGVVGLLINREYCAAALYDMRLRLRRVKRVKTVGHDRESFLSMLYDLVDDVMPRNKNVLGIGVASVGPLDTAGGMLLNPPRFYGICNIPLAALLKERYGLPVFVDHQYHAAAKAEKLFGGGKRFSSFVFVGVTNGIGAGIYMDGRLLQSGSGLGSELGHMSIDQKGLPCECGNYGCLEKYAGADVICRKAEGVLGRRVSFRECCALSEEREIDRILEEALEKLAACLVSLSNLLNPEAIIMGHESVWLPERYMQRMEIYLNSHKLSGGHNHIRIQKASFGEETQLAGAVCNVLDQVFEGKLLFG